MVATSQDYTAPNAQPKTGRVRLFRYNGTENATVSWPSYTARDNAFDALPHADFQATMDIHHGMGIVKPVANWAQVQRYNYGYYVNSTDDFRTYFFIYANSYITPNNADFNATVDLITTYLPQGLSSFIERQNVNPGVGSIVDAGYGGSRQHVQVGSITWNPLTALILSMSGISGSSTLALDDDVAYGMRQMVTVPRVQGDTTSFQSPVAYFVTPASDADNIQIISQIFSMDNSAYVCGLTGVPQQLISGGNGFDSWSVDEAKNVITVPAVSGTAGSETISKSSIDAALRSGSKVASDNAQLIILDRQNPTNAISIPYSIINGDLILNWSSDPVGGIVIFEVSGGIIGAAGGEPSNANSYRIQCKIGISLPTINNGSAMALAQAQINNNNANTLADISAAGTAVSTVASSAGSLMSGSVGGAVGSLVGGATSIATNYASTAANNQARLQSAGLTPISASGAYVAGNETLSNIGVNVYLSQPVDSAISQLESYYTKHGYLTQKIAVPALRDGGRHYYQGDVKIRTDFATKEEEMAIMSLFEQGVWMFDSIANLFNYG